MGRPPRDLTPLPDLLHGEAQDEVNQRWALYEEMAARGAERFPAAGGTGTPDGSRAGTAAGRGAGTGTIGGGAG